MIEAKRLKAFVQYGRVMWDWRHGWCRLFWSSKKPCVVGMPLPDSKWSHMRITCE